MEVFGVPSQLQIVVGPRTEIAPGLFEEHVEVFVAGRWLTWETNKAFAGTTAGHVGCLINRLLMNDLALPFDGLTPEETHRRFLDDVYRSSIRLPMF